MAKITKCVVDALNPSDKADVFAWDSELKGFGVRVKPSGTKSFLIATEAISPMRIRPFRPLPIAEISIISSRIWARINLALFS